MKKLITLILILPQIFTVSAQERNYEYQRSASILKTDPPKEIKIPDVGNYKVLKCDLHAHTVFSDGQVWPDFRVDEAHRDGLDAIAITDHIEYQPHIQNPDLNTSYNLAKKQGDKNGCIVIKGIEITKGKPDGHFNALFIQDANPIKNDKAEAGINEAIKQGAFIQWNHPGWPDKKSSITPLHAKLLKEKKIHGVEVNNEAEFYPIAVDWAKEYGLAPTANSDIHATIHSTFAVSRPLTLVFANERSLDGIKEALFAGRTLAYSNNILSGDETLLRNLFYACVTAQLEDNNHAEITNSSDIEFIISDGKNQVVVPARKQIIVPFDAQNANDSFTIVNCFYGKDKNLQVNFN